MPVVRIGECLRNLIETSEALRTEEVSPVELTEECLDRIERLNPHVNAFITVTTELAREQARRAEKEIRAGAWRGPLHGVPIGLKDLVDTAGVLTTAGSRLYAKRIPTQSARVWQLLGKAGAVLLGKQNLHEFAYGGSSMISAYGPVRNPWNVQAIAGGSSGGSAAAVALGMGYAAIGTDTAGSIREPSALCGLVGLKPTFDRVRVDGVVPLSKSLDHVGPITRSVMDAAVVLDAISEIAPAPQGNGPGASLADSIRQGSSKTLRVGVPREYFFDELDSEVERAIEQTLGVVSRLVAEMREVSLHPERDRTLQAVESYEFHARSMAASPELYEAETLRRLRSGENISSEKRASAAAALRSARKEILQVFEEADLLVTPTTPVSAPMIGLLQAEPEQLRPAEIVLLRNTRPFNVWGLPAISVPCGFTSSGLPIGLQIAGAPWREDLVLRLAYAYEQATEWHKRIPPLAVESKNS
jgi:aspartyl-tRNA(Asn)/glutamyl-tRNA(Gln) amidotransferase subunit A